MRRGAGLRSSAHDDIHAGEREVSILAATWPEAVQPGAYAADHTAPGRSLLLVNSMTAYTAGGVIGRPSAATAAKGTGILAELFADHLAALRGGRT